MLSLQNSSTLEEYFEKIETKPEIIAKERQFEDSLRNFYRQKWFVFLNQNLKIYKICNILGIVL